jgi:hypothetical protein
LAIFWEKKALAKQKWPQNGSKIGESKKGPIFKARPMVKTKNGLTENGANNMNY